MELTLAITGASGTIYAHRTLQLLAASGVVERVNLIMSGSAATVAQVLSSVSATVNDWVTPDRVTFASPWKSATAGASMSARIRDRSRLITEYGAPSRVPVYWVASQPSTTWHFQILMRGFLIFLARHCRLSSVEKQWINTNPL